MTLNSLTKYTLALLLVVPMLLFVNNPTSEAADVSNRSLELADSTQSVVTVHTISFEITSGTAIGSIAFEYCSNSPLDDDPCAVPSGLDVSVAVIDSQVGETGFSIHGNTTANRLVLTRVPAAPTPGPVQYAFSNVTNADTIGSQYLRIYTYAPDDGTGAHTDRGGLAYSITEALSVSAYVPPWLRFCAAVTIPGTNCASATGSNVNFGILNEATTAVGTTQMLIATNGFGGYNVFMLGSTMTSGNNIIFPMLTRAPSRPGTQQFGMNLRDNSNPNIGANTSGAGTGTPTGDYSVANQFKFFPADVVARSLNSTNYNKFTNSYIVNINPDQPAGVYATTLTFIAFASF